MSDNSRKTPLSRSLNIFAERKVAEFQQLLGKALPASVVEVSGSIVTVKFELQTNFTLPQVTMPLFGPEYIRYPIQPGCKGMVIPADARLGGVSGLGSGVANLNLPANLSSLIFMPIANANWDPTEDPNKIVLYGPNGSILKSSGGTAKVDVTTSEVKITGTLIINGEPYLAHEHTDVTTGSSNTGGVAP